MFPPSFYPPQLIEALANVLAQACAVGHARYGLVHVYSALLNRLELVTTYGLTSNFIPLFRFILVPAHSLAIARAVQCRKRILIPDINRDPFYLPYLAIARQMGYQAAQATPILDEGGAILGTFATGFATVYHPRRTDTEVWDNCAAQAAWIIQSFRLYQGMARPAVLKRGRLTPEPRR